MHPNNVTKTGEPWNRRSFALHPSPFALFLLTLLFAIPLLADPFGHPSLKASVMVTRDARGIPYIKAANEHDLFFTQGYETASDRLFQMELLRRTVRGELAAILDKELLDE